MLNENNLSPIGQRSVLIGENPSEYFPDSFFKIVLFTSTIVNWTTKVDKGKVTLPDSCQLSQFDSINQSFFS